MWRPLGSVLGLVVLVLGLGLGVGLGLSESPNAKSASHRLQQVRVTTPVPPPVTAPVAVPIALRGPNQPLQPGPLAVASNGGLYVADEARDQILELLPDRGFELVAGNGQVRFSGDGGPAIDAELNRPAGMAVGADGTLYFADSGNDRVRSISPNGTIRTVAGDGSDAGPVTYYAGLPARAPPSSDAPAVNVAIGSPSSVAIGPQGRLYIAANNAVVSLQPDGGLTTVASGTNFVGTDAREPDSPECDPNGIAFDGTGDLYMTCANDYYLLEMTALGSFVDRGVLRPHDAEASIAPAPDGSVVTVWQSDMLRVTGACRNSIMDFDNAPGVGPLWPQGVAVAADGTIYADQDGVSGVGPPAIIELAPDRPVQVLWNAAG